MPGIALYIDANGISSEKFQTGLDRMLFDNRYKATTYFQNRFAAIGSVAYDEYPIDCRNANGQLVVLEGTVYRFDVANFNDNDDDRWLNSIDGDYLLVRVDRDGKSISILNDYLARLPLYIYRDDCGFIAAREVKFIRAIIGPLEIDPVASAEIASLDATLGNRTIYKNIEVLPPASRLRLDLDHGKLKVEKSVYNQYNFEAMQEAGPKPLVKDLVDLYLESCRRRLEVGFPVPIATLSGGMDSRGIAGGLYRLGQPFQAATYIFENERPTEDGNVARMLLAHIGVPWKGYKAKRIDEEWFERVLEMKDGLHNISVGFILKFYHQVLNDFGPKHDNWTGDGGDRTLVDVSGNIRPDNIDGALAEIHKRHNLKTVGLVEAELEIPRGMVVERLVAHLEQYPEKKFSNKLVHYTIMQRARRWSFEGEDRNRFFYNSVAPHFYRPLFDAAMSLPNKPKRGRRLYAEFMKELSPEVCQVVYAGYGVPIDSFAYKVKAAVNSSPFLMKLNKLRKFQKPAEGLTLIQKLRLQTIRMARERFATSSVN